MLHYWIEIPLRPHLMLLELCRGVVYTDDGGVAAASIEHGKRIYCLEAKSFGETDNLSQELYLGLDIEYRRKSLEQHGIS